MEETSRRVICNLLKSLRKQGIVDDNAKIVQFERSIDVSTSIVDKPTINNPNVTVHNLGGNITRKSKGLQFRRTKELQASVIEGASLVIVMESWRDDSEDGVEMRAQTVYYDERKIEEINPVDFVQLLIGAADEVRETFKIRPIGLSLCDGVSREQRIHLQVLAASRAG